ncbi:MAG: hypothetical protein J7639_28675, partial [Paenibacillaceae bacterium]|nr:hypothetical protein [Paenibacillaceae bacterium]
MHYAPLFEYLPDLAEKETRTIMFLKNDSSHIPPGNYGLVEYYCVEPDCDCRRVMLHVVSEREREIVAVINFGWESRQFYEKWFGSKDKSWIDDLKGPVLNMSFAQASYARELLMATKDLALSDLAYVNRLKQHYEQFKRFEKTKQVGPGGGKSGEKTFEKPG